MPSTVVRQEDNARLYCGPPAAQPRPLAFELNGPLVPPGASQCVKEVPLTLALDPGDPDYLPSIHSEANILGDPTGKAGQA